MDEYEFIYPTDDEAYLELVKSPDTFRNDVEFPDGDIGQAIRDYCNSNITYLFVTVLDFMGESVVSSVCTVRRSTLHK
jgi:hypothetical protein